MIFDVLFPVLGESLPADHSYHLYSALAAHLPEIHSSDSITRFAPICGISREKGLITIEKESLLRVRTEETRVKEVVRLAGKALVIHQHKVLLGVPSLGIIKPCQTLGSNIVTFKNALTPSGFLKTAHEKLSLLGVKGQPTIPVEIAGAHAGEPKRKVIRIKGLSIIGYSLLISGLSENDSMILQEKGLGGKTRIGCGFFFPKEMERPA